MRIAINARGTLNISNTKAFDQGYLPYPKYIRIHLEPFRPSISYRSKGYVHLHVRTWKREKKNEMEEKSISKKWHATAEEKLMEE